MGIAKDKRRFEVHLRQDIVDALMDIADKENRSLKNLMEWVLIDYANDNKPINAERINN